MIVDCHTQTWDANAELGVANAAIVEQAVRADSARHLEAVDAVDRAIVLAFKSNYLQAEISNRYVSEYVRRYSPKLIGFAGIDPTDDRCLDELAVAQDELGLKGITVSPALQNFHPADTRAMALYGQCIRRGMPVLFEQNHRSAAAKMEFARPMLVDEVAREFPALRIVVSHTSDTPGFTRPSFCSRSTRTSTRTWRDSCDTRGSATTHWWRRMSTA